MARAALVSLIVVMMASTAVSGCLSGLGGAGNTVRAASANTTNTSVIPTAMPDNRSGSFAAFNETNMTDMIGMHSHDYWNGRTRVQMFNGQVLMSSFPNASGASAVYRPPRGALVYEGTAQVEIVISSPQRHVCEPLYRLNGYPVCTDNYGQSTGINGPGASAPDPAASSLHLYYITAASDPNNWEDAGPVTYGTPVIIKIKDPKETDMPHSTGTLWSFRIVSSDPKDATLEFTMAGTIVRGAGAIPLWPGHPLFYAKGHYRLIYQGPGESAEHGGPVQNGFAAFTRTPSRLISAGTNTLYIYANITSMSSPLPPSGWWLWFHNASYQNWNGTNANDGNHSGTLKALKWVIKVDPNGMDSPYATQSRWQFVVRAAYNVGIDSFYGGGPPYDAKYQITIIATDLIPPAYDASGPS
ncbi:MAG: hypothetical protein ACYDDF_04640 [Thermoplasmatota archaeon]